MIFVGILIVIASVIGGFMIAGGNPVLLLHVSEFVTILGVAAGVVGLTRGVAGGCSICPGAMYSPGPGSMFCPPPWGALP